MNEIFLNIVRDARGNRTTQLHDAGGRVTTFIDGMSYYTTYQYDANNQLTTVIDANLHKWVTKYDAAGRPIQSITPLNHSTYVGYDALGQTASVTDALGHRSRTGYDAVGRVASMTDARLYVTTFLYDERSLLTGVQTANGGITTNSYNHRGDLTGVMNPLGVLTAEYTLDENGNVTVAVDGRGVRLSCTYDPLDRLKTVQYPDNTWATYIYDAVGQITTLVEQPGSCVYTYDPVGRVSTVARPDVGTVSYLYDAVGNRRRMKDPDGGIATYTYDAVNQMSALLNRYNENTTKLYNPVGLENDGNFGNGMRWRRSYWPDYNLKFRTLQHSSSQSSTQILRYSATYDAGGRRTTQVDPDGTATYSYDEANQLIREQYVGTSLTYDIRYAYDGMGNRTTMSRDGAVTTYTHDSWNRLLSRQNPDGTTTSFAYDGAGNRISETNGTDITTYTWDYENRMSGVQYPLSGGLETFTYLLDGERTVESGLGKGLRHSVEDSSGKRFMVWDDQNLLQERDASGSLIAHYTGRPDDYWSLISQRRGSTTLYAVGDLQGSVRQWFAANETASGKADFSAFGELMHSEGGVVTPFGYEGEFGYYFDAGGRLYVRGRELDTEDGIWFSVDPTGFADELWNMFSDVRANPVMQIDPRGTNIQDADLWVDPEHGRPYPAPKFSEDDELLFRTREALHRAAVSAKLVEGIDWYIAQAIGRDPASGPTHHIAGRCPDGRPYAAAFDIVLTKKYGPIVEKPRTAAQIKVFRRFLKELRAQGFACWHRWVGEIPKKRITDVQENEIHCIDPGVPSIGIPYLKKQLTSYRQGGSAGYSPSKDRAFLPVTPNDPRFLTRSKMKCQPCTLQDVTGKKGRNRREEF